MTFNPNDHLIRVQGQKEYLEVKWRLVWLREQMRGASIESEIVMTTEKGLIVRAVVSWPELLADGTVHHVRNVGHAYELWQNDKRKGGAVENAETSALGRALAHAGFGTQFATELEEDLDNKLADAPVERPQRPQSAPAQRQQRQQPAAAEPEPNSTAEDNGWIARIEAATSPAECAEIGNEMVKARVSANNPAKAALRQKVAELNGQIAEAVGAR